MNSNLIKFFILIIFSGIISSCAMKKNMIVNHNKNDYSIIKINEKKIGINDLLEKYDFQGLKLTEKDFDELIKEYIMLTKVISMAEEMKLDKEKEYISAVNKFKIQLLVDSFNKKILNKIDKPSEIEIKEYYNVNKDFFKLPDRLGLKNIISKDETIINKIYRILEKNNSIKFIESDTELKNYRITDLGIIQPNYLETELDKAAFKLKENKFSGIIKNSLGYNILFCYRKFNTEYLPFKKVKNEILNKIIEKRYNEYLEKSMNDFEKKKSVIIFKNNFKKIYNEIFKKEKFR